MNAQAHIPRGRSAIAYQCHCWIDISFHRIQCGESNFCIWRWSHFTAAQSQSFSASIILANKLIMAEKYRNVHPWWTSELIYHIDCLPNTHSNATGFAHGAGPRTPWHRFICIPKTENFSNAAFSTAASSANAEQRIRNNNRKTRNFLKQQILPSALAAATLTTAPIQCMYIRSRSYYVTINILRWHLFVIDFAVFFFPFSLSLFAPILFRVFHATYGRASVWVRIIIHARRPYSIIYSFESWRSPTCISAQWKIRFVHCVCVGILGYFFVWVVIRFQRKMCYWSWKASITSIPL